MAITANNVDLTQGCTQDGEPFGYVAGDGGGWFFTWRSSLERTLGTLECDEIDGGGGLGRAEVADFLRAYLPTTHLSRWFSE